MIEFLGFSLVQAFRDLMEIEQVLAEAVKSRGATAPISDDEKGRLQTVLDTTLAQCGRLNFSGSDAIINGALRRLTGPAEACNVQLVHADLQSVRRIMVSELGKEKFAYVQPDVRAYFENEALFGEEVNAAFPSAIDDIREAGNCIAVDVPTAAVFYLMCVAEVGLRTLAWDRRVVLKGKGGKPLDQPLELATWDKLLRGLEDAEAAIENFRKTMAREAQLAFYHGAMIQFRAFKNAFRNRVMHKRERYDRYQALSVAGQVGDFMRILAARIAEGFRTPVKWTKAELRPRQIVRRVMKVGHEIITLTSEGGVDSHVDWFGLDSGVTRQYAARQGMMSQWNVQPPFPIGDELPIPPTEDKP